MFKSQMYQLILGLGFVFCLTACQSMMAESVPVEKTLNGGGWTFQFANESKESVSVPHCWNAIDGADGGTTSGASADGNGYKRGVGSYTRTLDIAKISASKRYFVRCDGGGLITKMFVNDKLVGTHNGAFGRFCFEITDALKPSENVLRIDVDNTFTPDIPPVSGDFTLFGGLYRNVTLIETERACFDRTGFCAPISFAGGGTDGKLSVTAKFLNSDGLVCRMKILDADGKKVAESTEKIASKEVKKALKVTRPKLWEGVKNPYLYRVVVSIENQDGDVVDQLTTNWGFRTFEIDLKKGPLLNGKPMGCLRGVNRHQDKEGKGWALSPEDEALDIQMMRDMGVNAWRAAHYPHSENMYDLCDKAGLVVWAEIPVVDRVNESPAFFESAHFQLNEMIAQHRNHPSVVMWSISNELGNGPNGQKAKGSQRLMKELYKECKDLDPNRYCVLAANAQRSENEIVDHVGFNNYPGWYGGNNPYKGMQGCINNWCNRYKTKGICVSEYGAGASVKCHDRGTKKPATIHPFHPEEWQTTCHEGHLKAIQEAPAQLWGSFVWNMFDFGADQRKEGDHMGRNDKGLVTYDRKICKDAYYLYQANWTDKPVLHLCSKRWTSRSAGEYAFNVFSNLSSVTLTVKKAGKTVATQTLSPNELKTCKFNAIAFEPGVYAVEVTAKNAKKQKVEDSFELTITK